MMKNNEENNVYCVYLCFFYYKGGPPLYTLYTSFFRFLQGFLPFLKILITNLLIQKKY